MSSVGTPFSMRNRQASMPVLPPPITTNDSAGRVPGRESPFGGMHVTSSATS